jgi:hypothetical protein
MSVQSFKADLWEASIIEEFKGICIADVITMAPSRVDGVKAIWNRASLTDGLQNYEGNVEYEGINTTATELLFDQKKYFAYAMDDVDEVQLVGDVMGPIARQIAYEVKRSIDHAVLAEALKGAQEGGNNKQSIALDSPEAVYDAIVDLGTALDEKDVPEEGRFVIAHPEIVNLLAKDPRVIDHTNVLANGVVQGMEVNGMQVIKTTAATKGQIICLHNSAVGYGKQLEKLEALRLESSFSDAVRGLVVYGVKTLRPEAVVSLPYTL